MCTHEAFEKFVHTTRDVAKELSISQHNVQAATDGGLARFKRNWAYLKMLTTRGGLSEQEALILIYTGNVLPRVIG